jgi:ectoine hydroxylase-related dioxygenase (phytanoyl-CoA dioxygenase family)
MLIDEAAAERFREDGFILIRDVFDLVEIERFCRAIDEAIARRGDPPPPMSERDDYDSMFTQHFNLWEDSETVRELTFDSRLAAVASALIGAPTIRVYCDESFYKDPGSTETRAHQDYPLFSIAETDTVNAWVPLAGVGPDAGAIGYVKGSHRLGTVTNVDLALGRDPCAEEPLRTMLQHAVYLDVPVGSVVFHHVTTYHVARPNRTARTRKAFAITYFADGSTRGSACPHVSVDRANISPGEVIRGPATPVAWPVPDALPAPPPPMPNPPRGWPGSKRHHAE